MTEEEGGEEYAAFHQGVKGQQEAQVEEGLFYQPLGGMEIGAGKLDGQAAPLCAHDGRATSCARDVLWLHEFLGSVQHDAEEVGKWTKKAVHSLIGHVGRALGFRGPSSHDAACVALGLGVAFALRDSPFKQQAVSGVFTSIGCDMVGN